MEGHSLLGLLPHIVLGPVVDERKMSEAQLIKIVRVSLIHPREFL